LGWPPNFNVTEHVVAWRQVPELVLQHDHHLVGILIEQLARSAHARGGRLEGDVEMVVARQARGCRLLQRGAHDAPQGVLLQRFIVDPLVRLAVAWHHPSA